MGRGAGRAERPGLRDVRLIKVGAAERPADRARHLALAAKLGIAQRTSWFDDVEATHLAALYCGATAVAVPSLYEGFGLPAIEAMAQGAPVVASDRAALPETVGDAGLLVPSESDTLASAIGSVLDNRGLAAELGRRGLRRTPEIHAEGEVRRGIAGLRRPRQRPGGLATHTLPRGQKLGGYMTNLAIHPAALVSKKAQLGSSVRIGAFTIVHDDVVLGDGSNVENHCVLGHPTTLAEGKPLIIGANAIIRSHSIFYQGSSFGEKMVTGHRVTVRENTRAGRQLQLGTNADIQGEIRIGNYVRTQSNVYLAQQSRIGDFVWLFPHVVLLNDPHPPSNHIVGPRIDDYAAIGGGALLLPGITVGKRSLVAAGSVVNREVPPDMVVAGVPAKVICPTSKIKLRDGSDAPAYPWTRHFHRGYPEDVVGGWINDAVALQSDRAARFP